MNGTGWRVISYFDLAVAIGFSIFVLTRRREPAVTLAWILSFFLLPFGGALLYIFFGYRRFHRQHLAKPDPARRVSTLGAKPAHEPEDSLESLPPESLSIARLATNLTGFPIVSGNQVKFCEEANESYALLADAIRGAAHHVHLEYFAFQSDDTGHYFRDLMIEQAKKGAECRLLVDAVGSFRLGRQFVDPMRKAGVQVAFFWPLKIFRRPWGAHLRNHRKIAVIDGRIGFIGSQNVGNEYLSWKARRLPWQDVLLRAKGPVVSQFQSVFAEDWAFTTSEDLEGSAYFPDLEPRGNSHLQIVPTGPAGNEQALHLIFLSMVHCAQSQVVVMTPYFIPSQAMSLAMQTAARRGVEVTLLLPGHSDHWLTQWAGRSWYAELLRSGVRIFEHSHRFIHAKLVMADHRMTLLGSANMDVRSFLLNFEASLLIYDGRFTRDVEEWAEECLKGSLEIRIEDVTKRPVVYSIFEGLCRLLAPLL